MKRNTKIGPASEMVCWKSLRFFLYYFFGTAIFPNSVGKTRKQFLKRLQSKRPSVLLALILKEMKNYWFSERLLWNGGSWVLVRNECRGAEFGLGGLLQTVLWAWLGLCPYAIKKPESQNCSGQPCLQDEAGIQWELTVQRGLSSLHKIITSLREPALEKPKPKGDIFTPVVASTPCAVHKTHQLPDLW